MKTEELLKLYQQHPELVAFSEQLKQKTGGKYHLQGLCGSQLSFWVSAMYRLMGRNVLIILNEQEEALYLQNDLRSLMPKKEALLFPASYKRPYEVEEVDNANVLQRAEVLNTLNHTKTGRQLIITYAEALSEQVINKRSLVRNTLEIRESESCGMEFIVETLEEYGFEREDFVYEPGQYAVRGGIVDVYSFGHELPYRIEFFGEEIDSIRLFDPATQMSEGRVKQVSLIPNIQTQLSQEARMSFLEYLSPSTVVFIKSVDFVKADLDRMFNKAGQRYQALLEQSKGAALSSEPAEIYLDGQRFVKELEGFSVVEAGSRVFFARHDARIHWKSTAQPAFHKEFELLARHLKDNQAAGVRNLICANNPKQIRRLEEIFEEIDPQVQIEGVLCEIHEGFLDQQLRIACYTDHQIFDRYHRYKARAQSKRSQAITLKELRELNPRDYVVHVHHGIGQFAGLHTIKVGEHIQEAIKIIYKGGDSIFVNVNSLHKISKYTGKEGAVPKLNRLGKAGAAAWAKTKQKARNRVKQLAFDLVEVYAKRKATPGFAFSADTYMQRELEASFMYEDTPDQERTTAEVKDDMEKPIPMDRLVCGDVGFGKTEIAIRAAFKAAVDGKQTAVLVPTTILALQHYRTFRERLRDMPVTVDYVNRFRSSKQIKETLAKTA
ncbi:MAG: DEAD/DEAH box helicase, partial [Bacteroidetes bacterium]